MQLPFYILILAYAVGLLAFVLLSIFDIYHLIRFDHFTRRAKVYVSMYVIVFLVSVLAAVMLTSHIDWTDTFNLFSNGGSTF